MSISVYLCISIMCASKVGKGAEEDEEFFGLKAQESARESIEAMSFLHSPPPHDPSPPPDLPDPDASPQTYDQSYYDQSHYQQSDQQQYYGGETGYYDEYGNYVYYQDNSGLGGYLYSEIYF